MQKIERKEEEMKERRSKTNKAREFRCALSRGRNNQERTISEPSYNIWKVGETKATERLSEGKGGLRAKASREGAVDRAPP